MRSKQFVLRKIRREWMRCYGCPRFGMSKDQMEQISIHNWAVEEILNRIEKSDRNNYLTIVENFIKKMDEYACNGKSKGHWFSIAKDAGEWVLDILISSN